LLLKISFFLFLFASTEINTLSPLQVRRRSGRDHRCFAGNPPPPLLRTKVFLFLGFGMSWISITCIVLCFFAEKEEGKKDVYFRSKKKMFRDMVISITAVGSHWHSIGLNLARHFDKFTGRSDNELFLVRLFNFVCKALRPCFNPVR
jgi:hypothetical protein